MGLWCVLEIKMSCGMVRIINIGKGSSMLWVVIMLCIRIKAMHYSHNRGR